MNIHDVVRATQVAERVLKEHTQMGPLQRMEFCALFQIALFDSELSKGSAAEQADASPAPIPPLSLQGAGDRFSLTALTDKGRERLPELVKMLERVL